MSVDRLTELLREAGFEEVRRVDGRFFQPVIVGRRPRSAGPGRETHVAEPRPAE